jgi:hypothetical protein
MSMREQKPMTTRIYVDLKERITAYARGRGEKLEHVVNLALEKFLEKAEKKEKAA